MNTLNILTADFHNAIKNIVHFTAPASAHVPVLNAANLVIRDNRLVIEATDRYKLLQIRIHDFRWEDVQGDHYPLGNGAQEDRVIGVITVTDLKRLEQMFRDDARGTPKLVVSISASEETPEVLTFTSNASSTSMKIVAYTESAFPSIDGLFPQELPDHHQTQDFSQYSVEHFQALSKVQHARIRKNAQNIVIHSAAPGKPLHVYWRAEGDTWAQGLLMPIRIPEGGEPLARYF